MVFRNCVEEEGRMPATKPPDLIKADSIFNQVHLCGLFFSRFFFSFRLCPFFFSVQWKIVLYFLFQLSLSGGEVVGRIGRSLFVETKQRIYFIGLFSFQLHTNALEFAFEVREKKISKRQMSWGWLVIPYSRMKCKAN